MRRPPPTCRRTRQPDTSAPGDAAHRVQLGLAAFGYDAVFALAAALLWQARIEKDCSQNILCILNSRVLKKKVFRLLYQTLIAHETIGAIGGLFKLIKTLNGRKPEGVTFEKNGNIVVLALGTLSKIANGKMIS